MRVLKKMKRKAAMILGAALLITACVPAYADETETAAVQTEDKASASELKPGDKGYWEAQPKDKIKGTGFTTIAETDTMELQLKAKTGTLRWLDKETGTYKDTNLSADDNLQKLSKAMKADLTLSYYNGKYSELYSTYTSVDSFSLCVDLGQIAYQKLDNGVRIIYTLGDNSMTYKNFPPDLSADRMQELVLDYLDSKQISNLKNAYYTQLSSGDWHRKANKDKPLGSMQVSELYQLFYEIGSYTEEELYKDLEACGVSEDEYPSALTFTVPVEYTIENSEFIVSLDTTAIEADETTPIMSLTLLPYFLTSSTAEEGDQGYMFVPDGSGALINLDSTKIRERSYTSSWYGGDKLINNTVYSSVDTSMMMPIFGMKTAENTVFGIVENGAEIATLDAYIPNTDNSEPFSKIKLSFGIQPQQKIASDSSSSYMVSKASDDVFDETIRIHYYWLGEDADYVDMAACYRNYLIENGELKAEKAEDDAPLYIEVLGATDKTQYLLGIPYEGKQTLTSFDEARTILEDMNADGIKNLKLIYSGMVNGGMNQRALTSGVSFADGLGGKSDFNSLKEYADSINAQIFPNLLLQSAYTKKGLSGNKVAWNIVNNRGELPVFDPVTLKVDNEVDYKRYLINPNYISEYLTDAAKSFEKKTGVNTLASGDFMTFVGTNYRGDQVSPSTGLKMYLDTVKNVSSDMQLMLSDPIADCYAYCSYLTDIPMKDSGMRVLDASIPFMQLVLDGYKTYSAESLNKESTDIRTEIMQCIESRSAMKFTFTYRDSALLNKTMQQNLFAVDYGYWKDRIGEIYAEYEAFYDKVKGEVIVNHELFDGNDNLRIVTYSNGVKIYFNYSEYDEVIDDVEIPANSYQIME